jgi:UDP-glucose:glycoprotein glucosyltransferase
VYRPVAALDACGAEAASACTFLGAGGRLQLPGFGVEMAVKNMEYSALDDSKARGPSTFAIGTV